MNVQRLIWVVGAGFVILSDRPHLAGTTGGPGLGRKKILEPFKNDECTLLRSNRVNAVYEALFGFWLTYLRFADKVEKELLTLLALKEPTCAEIDALIVKYDLYLHSHCH